MWYAQQDGVRYDSEGGNNLSCFLLCPYWDEFSGEIFQLPILEKGYLGYDNWTQSFDRKGEVDFVRDIIHSLSDNPRRVHLRGVSCVESMYHILEYYQEQGYENELTKNYSLPADVLLTVSVSLRHLLWCEKDKEFLSGKNNDDRPYYAVIPPLRTPRDLRIIQQAARSGAISGIEVYLGDEQFIAQIFEKQILTPFQMTQLLYYTWKSYGFTGSHQEISIAFPDFLSTSLSESDENPT